jgi:hypothetical protein
MFGEECTVAVRDHFHFEPTGLEALRAEPPEHFRQNVPDLCPYYFFQIAQVFDPARTANVQINSGRFIVSNAGRDKTVALLLCKIQQPLHYFRPEPIGNLPVRRRLSKYVFYHKKADGPRGISARDFPHRTVCHQAPSPEREPRATPRGRFRRGFDAGTTFRRRR